MYKETTRSITITVVPTYLDDQSSPEESHYVWKYHVRIDLCAAHPKIPSFAVVEGEGRMTFPNAAASGSRPCVVAE